MKKQCIFLIQTLLVFGLSTELSLAGNEQSPAHKKYERSYLKPGAPVRLLEPSYIEMDPNSEKTISIQLEAPKDGTLTIEARPQNGLNVAMENPQTIELNENPTSMTLTINSTNAGKHYLMFMVTYIKDQQSTQRSMGIAVQVGDAPEISKQKSSSPYVIMEAEETIH